MQKINVEILFSSRCRIISNHLRKSHYCPFTEAEILHDIKEKSKHESKQDKMSKVQAQTYLFNHPLPSVPDISFVPSRPGLTVTRATE